jgi:hypothetical protein
MFILTPNEVAWLVTTNWPIGQAWTVAGKPLIISEALQIDLIATAYEESKFDAHALARSPARRADGTPNVNFGQADLGLWQLSTRWNHAWLLGTDWRDPIQNTAVAVRIFKAQGLVAWHAASDGWAAETMAIARMAHPRPMSIPPRWLAGVHA